MPTFALIQPVSTGFLTEQLVLQRAQAALFSIPETHILASWPFRHHLLQS